MKSVEPTGGVTRPIPRFVIMMTPKCTGSIPMDVAIGRRIGVRTRMITLMSIMVPKISIRIFIMIRMAYLLLVTPRIAPEIMAGTLR